MTSRTVDICIVSSGCLSSGPRVVKEADALASAGYAVHVIAAQNLAWQASWDEGLARGKKWSFSAVNLIGIKGKLLRFFYGNGALHRATRNVRAKLYIGHNLSALPIVAEVARAKAARYAFDAEDDHLGEIAGEHAGLARARFIEETEAKWLPGCAHVTAASEGIAKNLQARYGIPLPTAVHNVFPLSLRESTDGKKKDRRKDGVSFYWYSQTIGLDRGIQDALIAATGLRGEFEIHLRGTVDAATKAELLRIAQESGIGTRIFFHEQVPPGELLSRTMEHDVGLALEQAVSSNRLATVTNKIFFYFLGGLAVVATETPGQAGIIRQDPNSAKLYTQGDTGRLRAIFQNFIDDPRSLREAKAAALSAGTRLWNWERESEKLIALAARSVASPSKS